MQFLIRCLRSHKNYSLNFHELPHGLPPPTSPKLAMLPSPSSASLSYPVSHFSLSFMTSSSSSSCTASYLPLSSSTTPSSSPSSISSHFSKFSTLSWRSSSVSAASMASSYSSFALGHTCLGSWTISASSRLPSLSSPSWSSLTSTSTISPSSTDASSHDEYSSKKDGLYMDNLQLRRLCMQGALLDASLLFANMDKDLFSWSIMMSGYARVEQSNNVLHLFSQMQNEAMVPNKYIYATLLSACATQVELDSGKRMHARIQASEESVRSDTVIQTALVHMYGRFGEIGLARNIFDRNPGQDVVLWNAMLTVYSQYGQGQSSWLLYFQMQQLSVLQNKVTCVVLLSMCSGEEFLFEGEKLHAWIITSGHESDVVVGTSLIIMYSKCGSLEKACTLFDKMPGRDLIMWNSVMAAFASHEKHEDVFWSLSQMLEEGVLANEVTYTSILDACEGVRKGKLIHASIMGMHPDTQSVAGPALINMYNKCGCPMEAHHLFKETKSHQVTLSWNTMISAYAKHGRPGKAMEVYNQMQKEGVVPDRVTCISILNLFASEVDLIEGNGVHDLATCLGLDADAGVRNSLVSMYGRCGSLEDALVMYDTMSCQDIVTFVNIVSACTSQANLAVGVRIHSAVEGTEMERNVILGNALINMYSKCGVLENARVLFERMHERNVVTWSTMITTYAQHGHGTEAFKLFTQMHKKRIEPDNITLGSVLVACSHAGILEEASLFFSSINEDPNKFAVDHMNCMIDLLGRAGCLDCAQYLVNCTPFLPDGLSWSMLLCACQIHADVNRGGVAGEHLFELDLDDTTGYVLLSNMYGACGTDI